LGLGQLKISNHSSHDAVVKLKTAVAKETMRFVYVRAMSDVTISKITAASYILQFATGRDWDEILRSFRQDRAFGKVDSVLSFPEDQVSDGTMYSVHEVTLHMVPNGNVRKEPISAEEFASDLVTTGVRRTGR
jgi:hypothetical protein